MFNIQIILLQYDDSKICKVLCLLAGTAYRHQDTIFDHNYPLHIIFFDCFKPLNMTHSHFRDKEIMVI